MQFICQKKTQRKVLLELILNFPVIIDYKLLNAVFFSELKLLTKN